MSDREAGALSISGLPRDSDGPVFREPWEAQAFAMTLTLYEKGLFTWAEWAQTLADEIKAALSAGDADTGETYYRHWLSALETLIAGKGITTRATLEGHSEAWGRAAERTPYGMPIVLSAADFEHGH